MISILAIYLFCDYVGSSSQLSHIYSSIHESKEISIEHGIIDADNNATDLNHPVVLFKLVSKLYRMNVLSGVDLLGAAAGIINLLKTYNISKAELEEVGELKEDHKFDDEDDLLLLQVQQLLEEQDGEDVDNNFPSLEDSCGEHLTIFTGDQYCYIENDIKNLFIQVEVLSSNPSIKLYHQVYSQHEVNNILSIVRKRPLTHMYEIYEEYLRDLPVNKVYQSLFFHSKEINPREVDDFIKTRHFGREGKIVFPENSSADVEMIERKLVKFNIITPEQRNKANLQIGTYGIGGYLTPHFDTFRQPGDQIDTDAGFEEWRETVMGFLSTVPHGGKTVFPRLGLQIKPRAGDVLVWTNIDQHNQIYLNSLHAGCPVVYGEKWVFNKSVL
ncbi:prolyl 4-hydroxylase subunit alpha-1 isoform X2 [Eurytemora carolleeae]|uniref:prolyl 4-hydroxylase subunit alpha-1 isoform X2 n=1 Tax=Eurytemora carolleeae TaxID=1294199 RepID=UPI000C77D18B|nr:prolyl 4-hydroxylase subunit alpha-1 isoform X2 [Eurytemora carolleeae]|eukprot:XP_023344401.1 prolyl 4-hydroxylase subunit alpha-1-like isoform X2 [Eurytemora affinis]